MSEKRVFFIKEDGLVYKTDVTFSWDEGEKVLHQNFLSKYPNKRMLDVSSYSSATVGRRLSAFNLRYKSTDGMEYPVENVFQAGKVFEHGGAYRDLLDRSPLEAKRDFRLRNSGRLVGFEGEGKWFPLNPTTLFYNWVWINALVRNPRNALLRTEVLKYDGFSDMAFNHSRSLNCQAEAAALYVSLVRCGRLDAALKSPEDFCWIVYGISMAISRVG